MRTLPGTCCVLLFLLVPLLVLADQQPRLLLPGMPLDSIDRRVSMQHAAQVSAAILVGTIIDTTMAESTDGRIYTTYVANVDTLIAGPDDTGPVVRFRQLGGVVGSRSAQLTGSTRLVIERTYLLCIYRCAEEQDYSLWESSCLAEVVAGVAHPTKSYHTSPLAALMDTMATYARVRTPEYQKSQSDAVVVAHVRSLEYTDSRLRNWYSPVVVQTTIDSVLWSTQGPHPRAAAGNAQVMIYPQDLAGGRIRAHNPHLVPDSLYLLFLQWRHGTWVVAPSLYSAWRRDGDTAIVQTHAGPCGRSSVIASIPWSTLMSLLR